ncbi:MAG: C10 family peptidase [Bacteroidetes bacterium]|nr:C10 family peptidase [Bacteroidota bacterium]
MRTISRLLFILVIILPAISLAEHVSPKLAGKVACNFYFEKASRVMHLKKSEVQISDLQIVNENGKDLFYIFSININKGFVLVSATDQVVPVMGYSFEGNFRLDDQPENLSNWMSQYKLQITRVLDENLPTDPEVKTQWKKYSAGSFTPEKSILNVNPLVTTMWDQGCDYNAMCPTASGGPCNRVWAGCVATAMGMVMKYNNYPPQGTGSHSYPSQYGTLSANFGATTYDWANMPDALWGSNTAVATLLYHCGISVNMNYGTNGSGAYTPDVRTALVTFFDYSSTTLYAQRMSYSNTGWQNLLKGDLDAGRPIVYSGQDPDFGHCFVCDGYQGTNYFHFNWGWSGWNNGYFYLDNMNSGNGTFNSAQAAVVHIAPSLAPTAQFTASATTICSETTVQFTDASSGNPTSWNWSFPGGTPSSSTLQSPLVIYNVPGQHDVTLSVTNSFSSNSLTKTNYIKTKSKPYGTFPEDTLLCDNQSITLDAGNPGASYIWSTGANTQTIVVDSNGIGYGSKKFFVEILSAEGCWNKDSVRLSFGSCAGIPENDRTTLQYYPNPTRGMLYIKNGSGNYAGFRFQLFDSRGLKVSERETLSPSDTGIDLSQLPEGLYLVVIDQQGKRTTGKLTLIK